MASTRYFAALRRAELGQRKQPVGMGGALAGLCSGEEYGFWSVTPGGAPVAVPPFALSFSTTAMGGHALAAGDEEGIVTILDTRRGLRAQMEEPCHPRFTAHDNAIFDVAWLHDDRAIATAGGDATTRVFDVETNTRIALLRGHAGSAKCVRPCPSAPSLLFSAGRDGHILGFDLRAPAQTDPLHEAFLSPVLKINSPHTRTVCYAVTQSIGRKRRRVQADSPAILRGGSVTSLAFSPSHPMQLYSSGASDGAVKLWDLRRLQQTPSSVKATDNFSEAPLLSVVPGNEARHDDPHKVARPHGIANIDIDASGRRLLVSSTNSVVYVYDTNALHLGYSKILTGHTQTSFYIRARFSPDGQFVLSGSADTKAYIWDLTQRSSNTALSPILELAGHRGGEASAVDWCKTDMFKVATCADDSTAKVWTLSGRRGGPKRLANGELPECVDFAKLPTLQARHPRRRPTRIVRTKPQRCFREQDIRVYLSKCSSLACAKPLGVESSAQDDISDGSSVTASED
jgi:WD40 repeat protein